MSEHNIADELDAEPANFPTPWRGFNTLEGRVLASGTTVPTDATEGYAPGCIFFHTDGADGTYWYINRGTKASCNFDAVGNAGVAPASAYTQTYSTANKTIAAPTATAPATLTDSTGLSGTHDDTLAATTVPAALTENTAAIGGTNDGDIPSLVDPAGDAGASVIAGIRENATKINTIITLLGVMAQNDSDIAQKVIELRTSVNALVADDLDNRQGLTAVIDDLQAAGIVL